jgi:hypothetical protein
LNLIWWVAGFDTFKARGFNAYFLRGALIDVGFAAADLMGVDFTARLDFEVDVLPFGACGSFISVF